MEWAFARPKALILDLKKGCERSNQNMFAVVNDENQYQGLILSSDLASCPDETTAEDVLKIRNQEEGRRIFVTLDEPLAKAKEKLATKKLQFIPVVDDNNHYMGTIDWTSK